MSGRECRFEVRIEGVIESYQFFEVRLLYQSDGLHLQLVEIQYMPESSGKPRHEKRICASSVKIIIDLLLYRLQRVGRQENFRCRTSKKQICFVWFP